MKLRNKKTGAIYSIEDIDLGNNKDGIWLGLTQYNSLAELNEDWEDAPEEPKGSALDLMILTLTNFIENEPDEDKVDLEDCKQMLEKLKAWKRLKDKGFKAFSSEICGDNFVVSFKLTNHVDYSQSIDDFDCIFDFGGEE